MRRSWAQLIKRIYEVDPLVCPSCGAEMKVIAFIIDHAVVDKILRHLKRRDEEGRGRGPPGRSEFAAATAIWLGIALDGIPESLVIGMLVVAAAAEGSTISLAFILGVFMANLPEALSSAVTMRQGGMKTARVLWMWMSLFIMTAVGASIGAAVFPAHPEGWVVYLIFAIEGLAGGAMLTMIAETMLPEAFEQGGGTIVGLSTLAGYLAALSVKLV
jgi:zinc transporter ZupT